MRQRHLARIGIGLAAFWAACSGGDPTPNVDPSNSAALLKTTGALCQSASDCASHVCTPTFAGAKSYCRAPNCDDGVQNGDETGIDCGGSCAPRHACSAPAAACVEGRDCVSKICAHGLCAEANCWDGIKNGDETGVDCGGSACGGCQMGSPCGNSSDCISGICSAGYCRVPASCEDKKQDGAETGVDCGGPCRPCGAGVPCRKDIDCQSMSCGSDLLCAPPSCDDGVKNGTETDVDCGGTCSHCENGQGCASGSDCASGQCDTKLHMIDPCYGAYCVTTPSPDGGSPTMDASPVVDAGAPADAMMTDAWVAPDLPLRAGDGGMKCDETTRPEKLPDASKCKPPNPMNCNGWTSEGRTLTGANQLTSTSSGIAQLFSWTQGDTLCLYLYREFQPPPPPPVGKSNLNGLLCFNKTTCEVCAYDLEVKNGGPQPGNTAQLSQDGTKIENCSQCHRSGPIVPKAALYTQTPEVMSDLMPLCAARGGPTWVGKDQTAWPPGDSCKNVAAPPGCARCHTAGFVASVPTGGGLDFCTIVRDAMSANGSMANRKFNTVKQCQDYMTAMGCPALLGRCKAGDFVKSP